ncbi:MAG: hypothetical protein ACFFCH_01165 [Promethearchaeota archaeon]
MGKWRIILKSKELHFCDVLDKTGALMIRPRYINELKEISQIHTVPFQVKSPDGVNKLPSKYFVVGLISPDNHISSVMGLFEYAYGAIRLVALNNKELSKRSGDDMVAFFEAPLQKKTEQTIHVFEVRSSS